MRARLTFNEHVSPKLRETLHSNFVAFALVTPCGDGNGLIVEVTRPSREKRLWASLNSYEQSGFIKYEPVP